MTVEEFEFGDAEPAAPTSTARRSRRGAPPWAWALMATALVLVGTATARPVPYLGGPSGLSIGISELGLREAPTLVWETSLSYASLFGSNEATVVAAESATGLDQTLVGYSIVTGAEAWRYADPDRTCQWGEPIVCVTDPGADDAAVVVLDLESGIAERSTDPGVMAGVAVPDGMVLAYATGATKEELVRLDDEGVELWRIMADVVDTESTPFWAYLSVRPGYDVVNSLEGSYDIATGEPATESMEYAPGGGVLVTVDGTTRTITTPDGDAEIASDEILAGTTDAIGGHVLLRETESTIVAEARSSRQQLWSWDESECYVAAQLRGVVLLVCWGGGDGRLVALEERTGATLWQADGASWPWLISSDTVLVSRSSMSTSGSTTRMTSDIEALDLHTGVQRWQLPGEGASGYWTIDVPDGLLLAFEDRLIRLEF